MNLPDLMADYALEPTPRHRERLHRAIMSERTYDPLVSIGPAVDPLARAGDHLGVLDALRALMPGALLNPTAHAHLSHAHAQLGDEPAAARERRFALLAMNSIRDDADGSEESPYPVLRIEDEYSVLDALRQRTRAQAQLNREDGAFDVHTLDDGSHLWFRLLWREAGTSRA